MRIFFFSLIGPWAVGVGLYVLGRLCWCLGCFSSDLVMDSVG